MMAEQNLIHLKFDYLESKQSKKEILLLEMKALRINKIINNYKNLRSKELKLKSKLYTKIKELRTNLNKIQKVLPEIKIPKILKQKTEETPKEKPQETKAPETGVDLELRKIQEKLNKLEKETGELA